MKKYKKNKDLKKLKGYIMYTAIETANLIKNKKVSCEEVVKNALDMANKANDRFNAFITIENELAIKKAREFDSNFNNNVGLSVLAGMPIAIKDNICTKGIKTTAASKILSNFIPTYDATVVDKLKRAGMIIIGKTNMDEFGMGSTCENSFYGGVSNPYDERYVSGGSSGGSCAYVAYGNMCNNKYSLLALGTDTGGSIRQPASYCGVVGLKPTYSTVSRNGLIAYASSFDSIGSIAGNVCDSAALLEIISGCDNMDATTKRISKYFYYSANKKITSDNTDDCDNYNLETETDSKKIEYNGCIDKDISGMRIGIVKEFLSDKTDGSIKDSVSEVIKKLEDKGAIVEECSLGLTNEALKAYYIIACAQASSNLARYDGVKYGYRADNYENLHDMYKKTRSEGFGLEVKRRIMLGSYVLSSGYYDAYYLKALKVRRLVCMEYDKLFKKYDALLSPCATSLATLKNTDINDSLSMYLSDICTVGVNLTGNCAISFPCGKNEDGLPIGLQFIGNKYAENKIISLAYAVEAN